MNENIDLTQILKDCPKDTKLYSTIFGEVKFKQIKTEFRHQYVIIELKDRLLERINFNGKLYNAYDGECILFPSKDQRDWSKFVPPCKFKDGDIVATSSGLHIFILERVENYGKGYCYIGYDLEYNEFFRAGEWYFSRLATEEEKRKFFDAIKVNGYKWNAETKTLEKLIQPKFKVGDIIRHKEINKDDVYKISKVCNDYYGVNDLTWIIYMKYQDQYELVPNKFNPKTLKPFDRVLVRDYSDDVWNCSILSHRQQRGMYNYTCTNGANWKYCIPYNEETKHLVGTSDEAPEFYRYWED